MATIDFDVPTVHCTSCKLNIEEALADVGGVTASTVDVDVKRVRVAYAPVVVDPDTITTAITDAGHPVA